MSKVLQFIQNERLKETDTTVLSMDSTCIKASPHSAGSLKKSGVQSFARTKGGINTKLSVIVANPTTIVAFGIVPGNYADGSEGRRLLNTLDTTGLENSSLLMDRAYEGNTTRTLAQTKGFIPVVPPKKNRKEP